MDWHQEVDAWLGGCGEAGCPTGMSDPGDIVNDMDTDTQPATTTGTRTAHCWRCRQDTQQRVGHKGRWYCTICATDLTPQPWTPLP